VRPDDANLHSRRLRLLAILIGILLLVWLPFEDLSENWTLLFAIAIAGLAAYSIVRRIHRKNWIIYPLAGTLTGLTVTLLAITLMAFKSGVHGHGFSDYTPTQVVNVIRLTPVWVVAGLLIGSGLGLMRKRETDLGDS